MGAGSPQLTRPLPPAASPEPGAAHLGPGTAAPARQAEPETALGAKKPWAASSGEFGLAAGVEECGGWQRSAPGGL